MGQFELEIVKKFQSVKGKWNGKKLERVRVLFHWPDKKYVLQLNDALYFFYGETKLFNRMSCHENTSFALFFSLSLFHTQSIVLLFLRTFTKRVDSSENALFAKYFLTGDEKIHLLTFWGETFAERGMMYCWKLYILFNIS